MNSDRQELSRAILSVLEDWGADARQVITLLALPVATKPQPRHPWRVGGFKPWDSGGGPLH